MRSLILFSFAALGAISVIDVGARPGGIFSISSRSLFDILAAPLKMFGRRVSGKFDPSKIRRALDTTGQGENIEYPELFSAIIYAVKKEEMTEDEAYSFFQWMSLANPPRGYGTYMHCFGYIPIVMKKLKKYDTDETLREKPLKSQVQECLGGLLFMIRANVRKEIVNKIAPSLTALIENKGNNPKVLSKNVVKVFLEDRVIKRGLRDGLPCLAVPPSGKAWTFVKDVLDSVQQN